MKLLPRDEFAVVEFVKSTLDDFIDRRDLAGANGFADSLLLIRVKRDGRQMISISIIRPALRQTRPACNPGLRNRNKIPLPIQLGRGLMQ
jgi:hypothetical protein